MTRSTSVKFYIPKILRLMMDAADGVTVESSLSFLGCHPVPICVISQVKMPLQFVFSLLFPLPGRQRAASVALPGIWNWSKSELDGRAGIVFPGEGPEPQRGAGSHQVRPARRQQCQVPVLCS